MGKIKHGFKNDKQLKQKTNIVKAQKKRWRNRFDDTQIDATGDHGYGLVSQNDLLELNSVADDILIEDEGAGEWRTGRRVVKLGILADALSACKRCGVPLQLSHAYGITTYGLGAIIKVPCSNTQCGYTNNVPTGKRHNRIWDANTKLATAMLHAGVGGLQINKILTTMNIPPISNNMIVKRQKEAGKAIEEVATKSTQEWLSEEVRLSEGCQGEHTIAASVDAGWQKRGSGKSYDSLSGHCSMIGVETGKIISYAVRSKTCRVCESATRLGKNTAVTHDCRLNYDGSAKSMEPDMVVSMVKSVRSAGVKTSTIIADDDTTTNSRLRSEVDSSICKRSDKNHVKKNFTNCLYSLQKTHKALTSKVIHYLQKCFNYAVAQNKGNPDSLDKALSSISKHPFGDHEKCDPRWCSFVTNKNSKYKNLPFGRPLTDLSLQKDLDKVICSYRKNCSKLSSLGSTQANEAFNKMVATKALHFSGSANLNYRIAASVAQKNRGYKYLLNVHKNIGLSPGEHTKRRAVLHAIQTAKKKAISSTYAAKNRRLKLKCERYQRCSSKEVREGVTYMSEADLKEEANVTEIIPPPCYPPVETTDDLSSVNAPWILFDLETTGLGRDSHITQIAAISADTDEVFSTYVMPQRNISKQASKITGITKKGNQLFHNASPVKSMCITEALKSFLNFLQTLNKDKVVLVGHNIKSFDSLVLITALHNCQIIDDFIGHIACFLDTRKLFQLSNPELKSFSQVNLVKLLLNEQYDAHNALDDVKSLKKLLQLTHVSDKLVKMSMFSTDYAVRSFNYSHMVSLNIPTLNTLINQKIISNNVSNKIAGSGLRLTHLKMVYQRNGRQGIEDLFAETLHGKVRVTKSGRIIGSVCDFLSKC